MINEKEKKRIQRYCVYPKVAMVALIMAFVLCLEIIPLEMVDDLVFHNKGFQPRGLYTAIALIVLNVIIFCFCTLRPRFGMRGAAWKTLQTRLQVDQKETDRSAQVAGTIAMQASGRLLRKSDSDTVKNIGGAMEAAAAVSAVATAADILSEIGSNAESMAEAYRVPIPNIKKRLVAFAILPVMLLIGMYIPQYMEGNQKKQENIEMAAEQINKVKAAMEPVCEYVSADNPKESYRDYGYHVIGNLRQREDGVPASYIYFTFNESGVIQDIHYTEELDVNQSLEENLNRAEKDFEILHKPLKKLDVSVMNPELLTIYKMPEKFKEAFLAGSLYESIRIHTDNAPVQVSCSFDTDTKEEFDEYSRPVISLMLRGSSK